jgi:pimeloyl-ACP methyl ester carboxylesterase
MRLSTIPCLGYDLQAAIYEGTDPSKLVLNLIGWTSSKERHHETLEAISSLSGASVMSFNYSGHGDTAIDPFELRPAQHLLEVITVFDWITATFPDKALTIMGSSYGGYMGAQVALYRNFSNLILCAPAIYRPEDLYTLNKNIPREAEGYKYRIDTAALAANPLLTIDRVFDGSAVVVSHELDDVVPAETTDAYTNSFNAEHIVAPNIPHSVRGAGEADRKIYQQKIADWLRAH